MPLNIACQMDPIESIDVPGDSTLALLLAAQDRGHKIFYYTPSNLSLRDGRLLARGATLTVRDEPGNHFDLSDHRIVDLGELDVVLLRQDPPFDMGYITTTHMLERIHPKTLVVNDPAHVRNAPEKIFVLDFADLMPPTWSRAISRTSKPSARSSATSSSSRFTATAVPPCSACSPATEPCVPGRAVPAGLARAVHGAAIPPEVRAGDKRIILVDGEVGGIINRVPAPDEARSNMHVGGRAEPVDLTDRDREICAALGPELKRRGLIFTGIDVIGPYLTEINVTSPTGIREVKNFGGADIAVLIWQCIEAKRA